jgi:hypothetical protein
MRMRVFLFVGGLALTLPAALASGCGPSVASTPPGGGGGGNGGSGGQGGGFGMGGGADGGLADYTDPGCPDAGPKTTMFTCDAYHQDDGECAPGQGCYVFVEYPTTPCSGEIYGSECGLAGPGMEGDPCGSSTDCAAGFTCVVSGQGDQCVQLCDPSGNDDCPSGDVCQPIDVLGFGGCL